MFRNVVISVSPWMWTYNVRVTCFKGFFAKCNQMTPRKSHPNLPVWFLGIPSHFCVDIWSSMRPLLAFALCLTGVAGTHWFQDQAWDVGRNARWENGIKIGVFMKQRDFNMNSSFVSCKSLVQIVLGLQKHHPQQANTRTSTLTRCQLPLPGGPQDYQSPLHPCPPPTTLWLRVRLIASTRGSALCVLRKQA